MKRNHLLYGALALALFAVAAVFLTFFERYTEERDSGWSTEAYRNPYLAAERFLDHTGLPVRREEDIASIRSLREDDTLLLGSSSFIYNDNRLQEFMHWVERGGHAIVIARQTDGDGGDALLEALDVTVTEGELDDFLKFALPVYSRPGGGDTCEFNRTLAELLKIEDDLCQPKVGAEYLSTLTAGTGDEFQVFFDPALLLQHPDIIERGLAPGGPVFWATIDNQSEGVPLIQFSRGAGQITLLADDTLWQSQRIGQFGHAWLLYQLAGAGEFVLLARPRFDSLGQLAARYAAEFFLAGTLALLLWLLYRASRFGLAIPEAETARRSLREHIAACGYYYWHDDRCRQLLGDYRSRVLRRLGAGKASAPMRRSLCQRLAAASGMDQSTIAACLWGAPEPDNEEAFTQQIRCLQRIEATL
ncbi:DUF4350 domain-containing protein [Microbulbifer yueqingensis]|uniref:DUF4350 domain-containing protein n=1 Tax=Microbulbifer yueqingensis TaxID=658219 RepID=A0A1G9DDJ2_9GAMM|nr:DUF4350 domain-containing protein [Microbulbifer yueqingensis]SDK61972.1 hypothetical protein SAMN05216212_2749 [Microbulbifer yueqingensis]